MRKKERIEVLEKKLEVLLAYLKLEISDSYGTYKITTEPEPEPDSEPDSEPEPKPDPSFLTTASLKIAIAMLEAKGLYSKADRDLHNTYTAELATRNRTPVIEPPQRKGKIF